MERLDASTGLNGSVAGGAAATDVLLFVKDLGTGGVERTALRLAGGWRQAGLTVSLVIGGAQAEGARHPVRAGPGAGTPSSMTRLAWSVFRQVRRLRPAVIFCPGNHYTILAVLLKIALGRACPPILAKVSNDLERRDMPSTLRLIYGGWLRIQGRLIDHFAVLSAPMAEEAVRLLKLSPTRVHIVPNPALALAAIDDAPRRARAPDGARRFVAVGRLERQKDYPAMLRAFAASAQPHDRLTIYGEGSARGALAALAHRLGMAERVLFAGQCDDMLTRLRDHDILLLSSRYEGQPAAVVEALSAGLDVIATRCCAGIGELLDFGALGVLVDPGDVEALARAIAAAVPGRQDVPRAKAKARAFTIEAAVPAYAAVFARVAAVRASARTARSAPAPSFLSWKGKSA